MATLGSDLALRLRCVCYGWVQLAGIVYTKRGGGVLGSSYDAVRYIMTQSPVGLLHYGVVLGSRRYKVKRTQCLGVAKGEFVRDSRARDTGGLSGLYRLYSPLYKALTALSAPLPTAQVSPATDMQA